MNLTYPLPIGTAELHYSDDKLLMSASFLPSINVKVPEEVIKSINVKVPEEVQIKQAADFVFANWFNTISDIDVADREQYEIRSTIIGCDKYASGNVKFILISYIFDKIQKP